MTLNVRLTTEEHDNLKRMVTNEHAQFANEGEFIRLLLWREWNRRKRLGPPKPYQWQSAARIGKPQLTASHQHRWGHANGQYVCLKCGHTKREYAHKSPPCVTTKDSQPHAP